MRTLSSALLLSLALATGAGAQEAADEPGLFAEPEESPVTLTAGLGLSEGDMKFAGSRASGHFKYSSNLVALVAAEGRLPGCPWVSLWGRAGTTVAGGHGRLDDDYDSDVSLTLAELNLSVALAGRGSPLAPNHELPRSYLDAYLGVRSFTERFEADRSSGLDQNYDLSWVGPQVGLHGCWWLSDTYADPAVRGWSASAGIALLPWLMAEGDSRVEKGLDVSQDSDTGYGYIWSLAANYRRGPCTISFGYEEQHLYADSGREKASSGSNGDFWSLESQRRAFFLSLTVNF